MTERARVAVVAEEIARVADEGSLRFLRELLGQLAEMVDVHAYHTRGDGHERVSCTRVHMSKLWVSADLRAQLRQFAPQALVYIPSASATPNALWRSRRLAACAPDAMTGIVTVQHRSYGILTPLVRWLRPPLLIATSRAEATRYEAFGWRVATISLGVDQDRFTPADATTRAALRGRFGWPEDRRVVLHVGHLRAGRGLNVLETIASRPGLHVVMVASSSTAREESLGDRLRRAGVELHLDYQSDIQQYYQAADVYCFPVRERDSAIDFPLSVMEAMACDLPVLTTPHGSLPELFGGVSGLAFFSHQDDPGPMVEQLLQETPRTREAVEAFGWPGVAEGILRHLGVG